MPTLQDKSLPLVCDLLGVTLDQMNNVLEHKTFEARDELMTSWLERESLNIKCELFLLVLLWPSYSSCWLHVVGVVLVIISPYVVQIQDDGREM